MRRMALVAAIVAMADLAVAQTTPTELPAGAKGFAGMVAGKVISKGEGSFIIEVTGINRTWDHSKAAKPESLVGKQVEIRIKKENANQAMYLDGLQVGDSDVFDLRNRENDSVLTLMDVLPPEVRPRRPRPAPPASTATSGSAASRNTGMPAYQPAFRVEYATYLGGSQWEQPREIIPLKDGSATVGGQTASDDLPVTKGALQTKYGGEPGGATGVSGGDCFVAKINSSGSKLDFCTYFGGSRQERAVYGMALDRNDNIIITTPAAGRRTCRPPRARTSAAMAGAGRTCCWPKSPATAVD